MDITPIDEIVGNDDGTFRYYLDHDNAHERLAHLRRLREVDDQGPERTELEAWIKTTACFVDLDVLTNAALQVARSKSAHLKGTRHAKIGKRGEINVDTDAIEAAELAYRREVVLSQAKRAGNFYEKRRDGSRTEITSLADVLRTMERSPASIRFTVTDIYQALEDFSHLEAGRGN